MELIIRSRGAPSVDGKRHAPDLMVEIPETDLLGVPLSLAKGVEERIFRSILRRSVVVP